MGGLGPKNKHGERGLSCACEKERSARRVPSSREGPLGMKCFTRGFAAEAQPPHKPDVQGSLLDRPSAWGRQPPRSLVTSGWAAGHRGCRPLQPPFAAFPPGDPCPPLSLFRARRALPALTPWVARQAAQRLRS